MKNEKIHELLEKFQFELPEDLIARYPPEKRGSSRLLIILPDGEMIDGSITDFPEYIPENSLIVKNNTRVSRRRIRLFRQSGGKIEALFLRNLSSNNWECLVRGSGRLKKGENLQHPSGMIFKFTGSLDSGMSFLEAYDSEGKPAMRDMESAEFFFEKYGEMPIPPYLGRPSEELDKSRYQTVYAEKSGSIAAPTAGLHLTEEILSDMEKRGFTLTDIELVIGYGTFAPLTQENFTTSKLHEEIYSISGKTCSLLNAKKNIIAVGTTTLRALESNFREFGQFKEGSFATSLFIYPPDTVKTTAGLLTNFHLPGSSLYLLVSAYRGTDIIKKAYEHAVQKKYRFYSYGDAMLVLKSASPYP